MFWLNETMRFHLCPGRTDMRKGINSLIGVVKEKMVSEVRNGDVFIFIGGNRRLMELLHTEDGGMVMYIKRLEPPPVSRGYFQRCVMQSLRIRICVSRIQWLLA